MVDLARARGKILSFCDETVFSSNQIKFKAWYPTKAPRYEIEKERLGFKAVAVVAAHSKDGKMQAIVTHDTAISTPQFIEFLQKLRETEPPSKWIYLFVDNLSVHHARQVKSFAESIKIELIYNGNHSSEYMPIERAWAWSKQLFTKRCISEARFENQDAMKDLVVDCIKKTPVEMLRKRTATCLRMMKNFL